MPLEEEVDVPSVADVSAEADELSIDLEDFSFEDSEVDTQQIQQETEAEIVLEPDISPPESPDIQNTEEETITLDLDNLAMEEPEAGTDEEIPVETDNGANIELEELASMVKDLSDDEGATEGEGPPISDILFDDEDSSSDLEYLELDIEPEQEDDESS